ncbi:MAG: hypothetical protein SF052_10310 [Bacteroidia bacterium]|nr:hypothetical protein [Bacteroidia bacterium]
MNNRLRRIFVIFNVLWVLYSPAILFAQNPIPIDRCKNILLKLWDKQGGGQPPSVSIRPINQFGKPAEYDFATRTIIIDPKAYDLCMTFSGNKDDALAFLIAHELVHSFQKDFLDYESPGFFAPTTTLKSWAKAEREKRKRMESKADIWGAILCYMSGYKVDAILPGFIEAIYDTFNLKEEDPQYDSKEERLAIARRSKEELEKTVHIFEMANYFTVLQQYEKDTVLFQYLIDDFKSAEFYNNLGLTYIMMALPKVPEPYRHCPYPLALDTDTRLEQLLKGRNNTPLFFLQKSLSALDEGVKLNSAYLPAHINRAAAFHLISSVDNASKKEGYITRAREDIRFVQQAKSRTSEPERNETQRMIESANFLATIINSPQNCPSRSVELPVVAPASEFSRIEGIKYAWEVQVSFSQNVFVSGKQFGGTTMLLYDDKTQGHKFYLQRVTKDIPSLSAKYESFIYPIGSAIPAADRSHLRKSLPTVEGDYFLIHDKLGMVYKMGTDHRIKEWALFRGV